MKSIYTLISISILTLLSGCLDFGDDIEIKNGQIDQSNLDQITQITGIIFPAETRGKHFFYSGSGVDDSLWLKASIPKEKKAEFLKNEIFTHRDEKLNYSMKLDRDWWQIKNLNAPSHYSTEINQNADFLGCSIGTESEEVTIYLHWFST